MALWLEIISGPAVGLKFPIQEGYVLGRTEGEILVPDPKISSLHAEIVLSSDQQLALVDKGSSNGLWVEGQQVYSVLMAPGVTFRAGKSLFTVFDPEVASPSKIRTATWFETLAERVPALTAQDSPLEGEFAAFSPAVKLEFIEGIQAEKIILLGYGPRDFGTGLTDVELLDAGAPPRSFSLTPEAGRARFTTNEMNSLYVNDKHTSSYLLQEGDAIRVGKTLIRISYMK